MKKRTLTNISLLLCMSCLLYWGGFFYKKWKAPSAEATIGWDVAGYYLYLPATFIYGDLQKLEFADSMRQKYQFAPELPVANQTFYTGGRVIKYPIGQALQYIPWFTAAHLYAKATGIPADGYTLPYQFAMTLGAWIIAFLGLYWLSCILLRYFSDATVALTLLFFVFGTNYLDYSAINGAMTHNWLFTLYTLLIILTIQYYESPRLWLALGIGACIGWATITRPTELLTVFIPLFWGINNIQDISQRVRHFLAHKSHLVAAIIGASLFLSIQLAYWKYTSGQWIVYSYDDQGFNWLRPHFHKVLLSYNTGWMVYSPIVGMAVLGIPLLFIKHRTLAPSIAVYLLIFTYLICAWNVWDYGGSLGMRAMVQSYPLWAFPMAAFTSFVFFEKKWLALLFGPLAALFIVFNFWLTKNAHSEGVLYVGQMTKEYFWRVLGKNKSDVPIETLKLLDCNEMYEDTPRNLLQLYPRTESDSTFKFSLGAQNRSIPSPIRLNLETPRHWARFESEIYLEDKEWDMWKMAILRIMAKDKDGKVIKSNQIRVERILNHGETRKLSVDMKIPESTQSIECTIEKGDSPKPIHFSKLAVTIFD